MNFTKNKKFWFGVAIVLIIIGIIIFLVNATSANSVTGKYVGTRSGETLYGSASTWETVIELKSDEKYTLTVTRLQSNTITLSSTGSYKTVGENNSIIIFTDSSGRTFQGEFMSTIRSQAYISLIDSGLSNSSGIASACYKS